MFEWLLPFSYLLASVLFILSIRGLASPKTAREGNLLGMLGMTIAIIITLYSPLVSDIALTIGVIILGAMVGVYFALKVKMTSLPQMIAAFNGLGGLSAVFISLAEILAGSEARTRGVFRPDYRCGSFLRLYDSLCQTPGTYAGQSDCLSAPAIA